MFNQDFFPTPIEVIERMLEGYSIENKVVLEPSAGKGDIVEQLKMHGAKDVIACEINVDLRKILTAKCKVISNDFLTVTSDMVSHIHFIVMNPPFSADEKHILHAFDIAPAGCTVLSLCNYSVIDRALNKDRVRIRQLIKEHGTSENFGDCFSQSERKTGVEIGFIKLQKPSQSYASEFDGFYLDDEIEEQANGIMSYNVIRDVVNRYVGAVKIYDEQLDAAIKMNQLTSGFFKTNMGMSITEDDKPISRNEFKKEMQKAGWKFVFDKMNMQKYTTKGLKDDINKFVEQQTNIPFTMRNIYQMIDIVIGTTSSRMDRAILEVFDRLTSHYHDNRYAVSGWKTNSHYLINQKFILPNIVGHSYSSGFNISHHDYYTVIVDDMVKALCFITGTNYDTIGSLWSGFSSVPMPGTENEPSYNKKYMTFEFGKWYEWAFFRVKAFKKQTMHFEFLDLDVWGKFNQHVSRLKGYPLFEFKTQTAWQKRQNKAA